MRFGICSHRPYLLTGSGLGFQRTSDGRLARTFISGIPDPPGAQLLASTLVDRRILGTYSPLRDVVAYTAVLFAASCSK